MKFGDICVCPDCNNIIGEDTIIIKRKNIHTESDLVKDYFAGEDEKICRKADNIFVKGYCNTCQKTVEFMILVDVKPIKCYSAEHRSDLVMINE